MRQSRYLNVILTVNALLLAGLIWTQVADRPLLADTASAQVRSVPNTPVRMPNAANQRYEMISALRDLKRSVDSMQQTVAGGNLRVEVTNIGNLNNQQAPRRLR